MKTWQRASSLLLALALAFTALAGCGTQAPAPAPADTAKSPTTTATTPAAPTHVKVAYVPSLLFAPLFVAMDKGYFKEQNLDVELTNVKSGQDAMVFLANGQLDFVMAGYSAGLFNAVARGLDVKVIAPMGASPAKQIGDPSPIVVPADSPVTTTKDLKGKKIAVTGGAGSAGSFLLGMRLKKAGLSLADVTLVNLALPDQPVALANKSIDAAVLSEPYATDSIKSGAGKAVDPGLLAGTNASGLITSGTLLKTKADVVNRFTTALMKGARDLQGDAIKSDANVAIFAKYMNQKPEVLKAIAPYAYDPNFNLPTVDLQNFEDIETAAGVLKLDKPVAISDVTDGGPVAAAIKVLGKQ